MAGLVLHVSGHGFGHATRAVALLRAVRERAPGLRVDVRTGAPHWIFEERDLGAACSAAPLDPGVVQPTGLDVDLPATLVAHEALLARFDAAVEAEARWLAALAPRLVVADVPALACAAAARAGVPCVVVANFTWDWILAEWSREHPRFAPIARRYRRAYGEAERAYRLPLHGDFSAFRDVVDAPFVVNRSRRTREECRTALGLGPDDPRRLVLVSFGGFGGGARREDPAEDLSPYRLVTPPGAPRGPLAHEDLMQACDVVIGKAGYGTIAEALAHGTRFLYLPRANFPEVPVLERGLERLGRARALPREDFAAGRLRAHLDALFAAPPPPPPPPCDGADQIAAAILDRLS